MTGDPELLSDIDKEVVMPGTKDSIDARLPALVKETLR